MIADVPLTFPLKIHQVLMANYLLQKFSCKKAKCGCKSNVLVLWKLFKVQREISTLPSFSWQKEIEFSLFWYLRSRRSMTSLDLLIKEMKIDKEISIR